MPDQIARDVLPIPEAPFAGTLPLDAEDPDGSFPAMEPLRPPDGAPNVLVILLDDVGLAASSAFGGPCATPTAERLAASGLKYNRFHTTALTSPMGPFDAWPTGGEGFEYFYSFIGAETNQYYRASTRARRRSSPTSHQWQTELTARHDEIPAWADTPDAMKPILARQHADHLITPQERLCVAMARQ